MILSLLEDFDSRVPKALLSVPHGGNQKSRFDDAVASRNVFMTQSGQPERSHITAQNVAEFGRERTENLCSFL
jgi:hypothetical protein